MYYRRSGAVSVAPGLTRAETNRRDMKKLARGDPPPGLIAYRGETPVGWVSLGPREDFARLERSSVMKPVDSAKVWSIICFVVPSQYRKQGVARALLAAAIAFAKKRRVRMLEAYPVDGAGESRDDALWFGTRSMYDAAGFVEVARRKPRRPVMRLALLR